MKQKCQNVWLGAAGLVINSVGEWLVVKKAYSALKGYWSLPAGFVEATERADEAACREVAEETGIQTKVLGVVGVRTGVLQDQISDNVIIYALEALREEAPLIRCVGEIDEVAWLHPTQLKEEPLVANLVKELMENELHRLQEVAHFSPGEGFGYTSYKLYLS